MDVKPLFNGFMELITAMLSQNTISHESHLVIEDVLSYIVKRAKGLLVIRLEYKKSVIS